VPHGAVIRGGGFEKPFPGVALEGKVPGCGRAGELTREKAPRSQDPGEILGTLTWRGSEEPFFRGRSQGPTLAWPPWRLHRWEGPSSPQAKEKERVFRGFSLIRNPYSLPVVVSLQAGADPLLSFHPSRVLSLPAMTGP